MTKQSIEKIPVYDSNNQLIIPQIVYSKNNSNEIKSIIYTIDDTKYHLSNDEGHKVCNISSIIAPRPMTKKEYKELCKTMILNSDKYGEISDSILATIEQLDFGKGHANSTFEIVRSCVATKKVGTLVLNIGPARYLFNEDTNSIFHIDYTRHINGYMLKSPEKEEIIEKIYSSKTMTKKIKNALNS